MPNNFKLTGNYYVSKAGSDSNDGLTADTPKRTISSAFAASNSSTIIVGSGVYNESLSKAGAMSIIFYADGNCIIKPALNSPLTISISIAVNSTANFDWFGFTFYNCNINIQINPNTTADASNPKFENCKFISCTIDFLSSSGAATRFVNCQFINSTVKRTSIFISYDYCLNVNSSLSVSSQGTTAGFCTNTYFDSTSNLTIVSSNATATYNNIQGNIIATFASTVTSSIIQDILSRYYNLALAGTGGSGTLGDPYYRNNTANTPFSYTNFITAYPTYSTGSFSADPKFNNIEDQDFTVQSNSPHIKKASDSINNIGNTKYALRRTSRISFSGSQATVDPSLIFQYDNYIISGSEVTGSVTSAPIAVNTATPKVIQKVTYNGLLAFNKDTGSASGSNQNVPDFDTFTSASGNAAANPDRLVYYMRHTTGSSIPVSDAGWDNGGLWTAGQYNVFEWNTKPSIDNLGVGNGSGSFNAAASPTFIQATYVQMQVKLRNDYLF